MEKDIGDDVSGDYGKLLLALLIDPNQRKYANTNASNEEKHIIETVEETPLPETPTLVAASVFNARDDSERLRKAMKGKEGNKKEMKYDHSGKDTF